MRRIAALVAALGLVIFGFPSPANAAPICDLTGRVCVSVDGGTLIDPVTNTVLDVLPLPAPVTITVPSPTTTTVTAPPPAPVTRTATRTATETATVTQAPVTQTTTATATRTVIPSRQSANPSATLGAPPNVPVPGPVEAGVDLIPDDPDVAAATGSLFGLFVGIVLGLVGLFVAYRRGQIDGEKATLKEFLGVIRGEPQPGRHRA